MFRFLRSLMGRKKEMEEEAFTPFPNPPQKEKEETEPYRPNFVLVEDADENTPHAA